MVSFARTISGLIRIIWGEINTSREEGWKDVTDVRRSYLVIVHGTHVYVLQIDREHVQLDNWSFPCSIKTVAERFSAQFTDKLWILMHLCFFMNK